MRGEAAPTTLRHPVTDVRAVVHGDDFTFAGTEVDLKKAQPKIHWGAHAKICEHV